MNSKPAFQTNGMANLLADRLESQMVYATTEPASKDELKQQNGITVSVQCQDRFLENKSRCGQLMSPVLAHNGSMNFRPAAVWSIAVLALVLSPCCGGLSKQSSRAQEPLVDVNHASVKELMSIPGMTSTWANRIVRFRPYSSKLALLQQGVVTPEVYQRIRDGIVAHRAARGEAATSLPE
jgi:DNA uptake protein ComE-like DNA-binding protein